MKVNRFHYYHQIEQSDCGITCLRMVARFFGQKIPVKHLRGLADLSRGGISIRGLKECAESIGLKVYGVKLSTDLLKEAPLPAIIHWNQNHFAVLYKIKNDKYYIADPASSMMVYSKPDFYEHFCGECEQGIALILAPTKEFDSAKYPTEDNQYKILQILHNSIRENFKRYCYILLLSILALIANICVPLLMQKTIDEGISQRDISLVWLFVFAQIAIFTGSQLTSTASEYIINKLGLRLSSLAVDKYLSKLVSLPLRFFDSRVSSDLIQKTYDQEQTQLFILHTPTALLLTIINLIVFSALLLWFNPWIFIGFFVLTLVGITWESLMLRRRRNIDYDIRTIQCRNNNNIYELVNGISDLKIHNAQNNRVSIWRSLQEKLNQLRNQSNNIRLIQGSGAAFLYQTRDLAITGMGATLVICDAMTLGTMVTISFVIGRLSSVFSSISSSLSAIQQTSIALDRSNDVMDETIDEKEGSLNSIDGDIILNNAIFYYPGCETQPVIKGINLTIKQNQTTAIVGPSGCGKSTLIKLIQGLYNAQNGTIKVGDIDIATLSTEQWGEYCTSVSQQGYIFSDTIARNIALGDENPDLNRVDEAIKMACLDPLVNKFPLRLSTIIGPSGAELSGGERQRLMIARAIYRNTPIVLLDEATSSLDAETERKIVENLSKYGKKKTMVIAAHRLSTISHADQILFMESGKIIEQGNHKTLMELGGRYASFVAGQLTSA